MFEVSVITTTQANKSQCALCNKPYQAGELRAGSVSHRRREPSSHAHVRCINTHATKLTTPTPTRTPKVKLNPTSNLAYAYCAAGRLP